MRLLSPYLQYLDWITGNPNFSLGIGRPQTNLDRPEHHDEPIVPRAVAVLISAAASRVAAANMTNTGAAQQITAAANETIAGFLDSDDICPRWPYPGPPPWLGIIASELTIAASALQPGPLQTGILQVAGMVLDRSVALGTGVAGTDAGLTRVA